MCAHISGMPTHESMTKTPPTKSPPTKSPTTISPATKTSYIQLTLYRLYSGQLREEPKLPIVSLTIHIYRFYPHYFPIY